MPTDVGFHIKKLLNLVVDHWDGLKDIFLEDPISEKKQKNSVHQDRGYLNGLCFI